MQPVILVIFLLGLLLTGLLGTETRLLFFWPGAAVLGLAGLLATLKWRLRILFPPNDVCLGAALLFGIYMIVRAALSPVEAYAREDLFLLAGCAVVYVLMLTAASHPRWRLALLITLLVLVVGNLAVGYVHLSGRWEFHVVPHFFRPSAPGRIGGFFANPNHLAAFLSFVLFLSAGWLGFGRGGAVLKLWLGFMTVAMAIGMALTVSRGALIGLGTGAVVFAALTLWVAWQTQRHLFWSLLGGGAMLALLGGAVLWKVNEEYLKTRMEVTPVTQDVRLGIWEAALTQHAQSPLTGAGARMFYAGGIQYRSPRLPPTSAEALFVHNEYLQMLADYGWAGAGLLALLLLAHGLNGLRFIRWFVRQKFLQTGRVQSTSLALCLGALAALAATLAHAVFEFHFHVAATALTAALCFGILANPGFEGTDLRQMRIPGVRLMTKLALAACSLALLAGPWLYGKGDYALARAQTGPAQERLPERRALLDQALAADPKNAEAWYQRGLAGLASLRDQDLSLAGPVLKAAAADVEQAEKLNPWRYLYPLALADIYDAVGRHQKALACIERALALAPLHEEPRLALGMHWQRRGDFVKAEMAYLWARDSGAWNEEGTLRWTDGYDMLLQEAARTRQPKPAAPR